MVHGRPKIPSSCGCKLTNDMYICFNVFSPLALCLRPNILSFVLFIQMTKDFHSRGDFQLVWMLWIYD